MAMRLISSARRATDKDRLAALPRLEKASRTVARAYRVLTEQMVLVESVIDPLQSLRHRGARGPLRRPAHPLQLRVSLALQLLGKVLDHRQRHLQRVFHKQPDVPHRAHLQGKPEPVVVPTPLADQLTVDVIQETEPLQLRTRRHLGELSRTPLPAHQSKLHRHAEDRNSPPTRSYDFAEPSRGPDHPRDAIKIIP
jgi:hypothetical protein